MPSTDTCTLSRVMQTCSGMSMAVSLSECRYRMESMKRKQDVKSGIQRVRIFAQPLDHIGALLRHDDGGLGDD